MSTTEEAVAVPQVFTDAQNVQMGTYQYGYTVNPDEWFLGQGTGPRTFKGRIKFAQPFTAPPMVMIALSGLDVDHDFNPRVIVVLGDVTPVDFEVVVNTWADAAINGVWGTWIAIG